jgi:ribosomal-protein-alanine N-acetyltransferase
MPTRAWSKAEYEALLGDKFSVFLHTETGFAIGRVIADEAELFMIIVAPEARGRGSGRDIFDQFLDVCRTKGATEVFLEVGESNQAARALYERSGFLRQGQRTKYYHHEDGTYDNAILYTCPFPSVT